ADEYVEISFRRRLAGDQVQLRVLPDFLVRDKLRRISLLNRRGNFGEITTAVSVDCNSDLRIARDVNGIVLAQLKRFAVGAHGGLAVQTNQTCLVIVVAELQHRITRIERDASVVQITRGRRARRDRGTTTMTFVRAWHETTFRRDWILF